MFADVMSTGRHRLCLASICEPDDICRTIIFWRGEKSLDYEKSPLAVDDLSIPVDFRLTMSRARLHLNDRYLYNPIVTTLVIHACKNQDLIIVPQV